MSAILIASAKSVDIGIIFSWVILLPGLATVLIIIAMVAGKGEKAENEKFAGRWGPRAARRDDD
jgi:hypothetical protein